MAARGAFCRTRVVLIAKTNVDDALKKWWAKYTPDEGQIIRHLSPIETLPVAPWIKTFPTKIMDRAWDYVVYLGGSLGTAALIINWSKTSDYNKAVAEERD